MSEQIAAVLDRLGDQPGRLDELRKLLHDPQRRIEFADYGEEVARQKSARYSSKLHDRTDFYAALVEREGKRLFGHGHIDAYHVFAKEIGSVLVSATRALDNDECEQLLLFSTYLVTYLNTSGRQEDGISLYEQMVEFASKIKNRTLELKARQGYGNLLVGLNEYEKAKHVFEDARHLAIEDDNKPAQIRTLNQLANIGMFQGRYEESIKLHKKCLAMRRRFGKESSIADSLHNLAEISMRQGRFAKAVELFEECLVIDRKAGGCQETSLTIESLGHVAMHQGHWDEAREYFKESIAINRRIDNQQQVGIGLKNLSCIEFKERNFERAEQLSQESINILGQCNTDGSKSATLVNFGKIAICTNRFVEAQGLLSESLTQFRASGQLPLIASTNAILALAYMKSGLNVQAVTALDEALTIEREIDAQEIERLPLLVTGNLLSVLNEVQNAAIVLLRVQQYYTQTYRNKDHLALDLLEEGMSRIAEVLTSDELAQLKAQAEAMSLEELTDFALKALEEVKAELGEKEERQVAEEQRVVGSDKAERGGEKPAISTESKGS